MIGTSLPELIFIRSCVFFFRYTAPLLIIALVLTLIIDHQAHHLTLLLEILTIGEVAFYILVCIPKTRFLQQPVTRPPPLPSPAERRRLVQCCFDTLGDPEHYLTTWFNRAPLHTIQRDNLKDFFAWAFLCKAVWGIDDDAELDEYVDKFETLLGRKLAPGFGSASPIRLTLDPVNILHRPLLWYAVVAFVDAITFARLSFRGFHFYRLSLARFWTVFPFRFITFASRRVSTSRTLSYWYRPHSSPSRKPVLFLHGIGIGLHPYASFLKEINHATFGAADGEIGVLAVELMPISSRITGEMPDASVILRDVSVILDRHGWQEVVLVCHSFGTVIAGHMLRDPRFRARIAASVLVDAIPFLLHEPDVAYNFTRRPPRGANEWQIYYFAATDMCVAHTLARRFFWMQNILWKEDLQGKNVTVALAGRDCIVPTTAVGEYLAGTRSSYYDRFASEDDVGGQVDEPTESGEELWREQAWRGEGLEVSWFPRCDHAQIFDRKQDRRRLVDIVRSYSAGVDQ